MELDKEIDLAWGYKTESTPGVQVLDLLIRALFQAIMVLILLTRPSRAGMAGKSLSWQSIEWVSGKGP